MTKRIKLTISETQ